MFFLACQIIVTVGGYEALHLTINSVTNPGDEVILIEPFFDSYRLVQVFSSFVIIMLCPAGGPGALLYEEPENLANHHFTK